MSGRNGCIRRAGQGSSFFFLNPMGSGFLTRKLTSALKMKKLLRTERQAGFVARDLPNVKVPVCASCNSGWMSRLENEAKRAIGPYLLGSETFVKLGHDDLVSLAGWAAKTLHGLLAHPIDYRESVRGK